MSDFDQSNYACQIDDIFHDINIPDLSFRAKIMLVRSYAEIIVRRLLDYSVEDYVTLGNKKVNDDLKTKGFTEAWFCDSLETIRKNGNACCHTQNPISISEEKWVKTKEALFNLFSYLFYQFFKKYGFDEKNPNILTTFSLLPPFLRHMVLEKLYIDHPQNFIVIDKLVLAKLKAFGFDQASNWINKNKKTLETIKIKNDIFPALNDNAYNVEIEKIRLLKDLKPMYLSFNDAKIYYERSSPNLCVNSNPA